MSGRSTRIRSSAICNRGSLRLNKIVAAPPELLAHRRHERAPSALRIDARVSVRRAQDGSKIMQVPHNACVVVADGRKLLFLRNEGDAERPNLQVEQKEIHPNPKDSDQKSDAAGRASSTQTAANAPAVAQGGAMHARGGGAQFAPSRGSMDETDFHQLEEDRFAAQTAEMLRNRALSNDFE